MEIRTVGGRRYNLDTAKKVGTSADATLYRKKNGEFFLHREGENKIESLIVRDARKWAKKNLTEEEYLSAFEYSDKKQQVLYSLPQYAIEKLRTMAGDRRVSASQLITDLIMKAADEDADEETVKPAPIRARLIDAKEGADYIGVNISTFEKWADEIGATRHVCGSVRYDLEKIDDAIRARVVSAEEGADYLSVSVPTFKKWADEIGATRHIRKSVRYDLTAIDEALNK